MGKDLHYSLQTINLNMETNNFYYNIYLKKSSDELLGVINNSNSEINSKLIAIKILEDRGELPEDLKALKNELDQKHKELLNNKISADRYSSLGDRFFANMIDGFILRLLGLIISFINVSDSFFNSKILLPITLLYPILYTILFHGFTGQTIGKMVIGIKIFDKSEKLKISFGQAILRDIVPLGLTLIIYLISILGLSRDNSELTFSSLLILYILVIWSILEIVTLLFNKKRRALHDIIAGTVVLKIIER